MSSTPIDLSMMDSLIVRETMDKRVDYRLVRYFDSTECLPCQFRDLVKYGRLVDSLRQRKVETLFIFSPNREIYDIYYFVQNSKSLRAVVAIDTLSIFAKHNPVIPLEQNFHTFLLDKDNKVILVGNPMNNDKIKELIFTRISAK